jgi:hypothetical protein
MSFLLECLNLLFCKFFQAYDNKASGDLHYSSVCVIKITLDCGLDGSSGHKNKTIKQAAVAEQ